MRAGGALGEALGERRRATSVQERTARAHTDERRDLELGARADVDRLVVRVRGAGVASPAGALSDEQGLPTRQRGRVLRRPLRSGQLLEPSAKGRKLLGRESRTR